MSLLYKDKKDVIYDVDLKKLDNGNIELMFSADCGKFGTDEVLDIHELTPLMLLNILQESEHDTEQQ